MADPLYISGNLLAKAVKEDVARRVASLSEKGIQPRMSVVLASEDPSALSYAQAKRKIAAGLGVEVELIDLGKEVSQYQLESTLSDLSANPAAHGILLELPLASGLYAESALSKILPNKDIDGLTPTNLGLVMAGQEADAIISATAQACIELAETQGPLMGKLVALVGRGRTVGRPLIGMLINRHTTITVCHTRTPDLAQSLAPCQIVIVAIGKPKHIKANHLTSEQIIIDAGINVIGESIVGDVDIESVREKVCAITPVPGGVGPLTSAIIFRNLIKAVELQIKSRGIYG